MFSRFPYDRRESQANLITFIATRCDSLRLLAIIWKPGLSYQASDSLTYVSSQQLHKEAKGFTGKLMWLGDVQQLQSCKEFLHTGMSDRLNGNSS